MQEASLVQGRSSNEEVVMAIHEYRCDICAGKRMFRRTDFVYSFCGWRKRVWVCLRCHEEKLVLE